MKRGVKFAAFRAIPSSPRERASHPGAISLTWHRPCETAVGLARSLGGKLQRCRNEQSFHLLGDFYFHLARSLLTLL